MPLLDRLGTSTRRLALAFLGAAVLVVCGGTHPFEGDLAGVFAGPLLSFTGGALFALTVASWQINASARARAAAVNRYWKPFSSDAVICLSIRLPGENGEENEVSPFTPYHDSLAGQRIQSYLQDTFGKTVPIRSATELDSLQGIREKHVILVGGPNHNHLTREAMDLLWGSHKDRYFHWSSTFAATEETGALVTYPHDHLVKALFMGDEPRIDYSIQDQQDTNGNLIEARGMCLRLKGLHRRGSHLLICAGIANAYGTLAAADYILNPDNIGPLSKGDSQVIAGSRLNGSQLDSPTSLRTITDED